MPGALYDTKAAKNATCLCVLRVSLVFLYTGKGIKREKSLKDYDMIAASDGPIGHPTHLN